MRRRLLAAVLVLVVGGGALAVAAWPDETPPAGLGGASPSTAESAPPGRTPDVAALPPSRTPVPTAVPRRALGPAAPSLPRRTEAPPPPPGRAQLATRLGAIVARPDLAVDGTVGIAVLDRYGRTVFAQAPDRPLLPASTQKAVTAAAALVTFGGDHRFETRIGVRGHDGAPVVDDRVVRGDLVLIGAGDPVLASADYQRWVYAARPRTPLEKLADRVVAVGVRRVTGGVVGDGGIFGAATVADGWKQSYFWDFDARHITGLTVDAGLRVDLVRPPPNPELRLTIAPDPAGQAASLLHRALQDRGVEFGAATASSVAPVQVDRTLSAVRSPPLRELLGHALRRSDNHLADTLFRTVGHAHYDRGSWDLAERAAREVLDQLGVTSRGAVFADGSGLSRADRATPRMLALLDLAMTASSHGSDWAATMAVAGETGTLRRRLRGTVAAGRFRGKTGTLDDVASVVGAVVGPGAGRYHLAVLGNGLTARGRGVVRVLTDELVLALAADLFDCRLEAPGPASPPPVPLPPQRSRAVCPQASG